MKTFEKNQNTCLLELWLDVLCGSAATGISASAWDTLRWENVNTSVPNAPLRPIGTAISSEQIQRQQQHKSSIGKKRSERHM